MNKKFYIVTSGEYSDYGIRAVFESREKAELYVKLQNKISRYEEYSIEEYETSDNQVGTKADLVWEYSVSTFWALRKDLQFLHIFKDVIVKADYHPYDKNFISCILDEENDEKAYKILQDKITMLKAELAGIV